MEKLMNRRYQKTKLILTMTFECQRFTNNEAFHRRQEIPLMQAYCERFYPRKKTFLFDFGTMADLEMTASV